MCPSSSASRRFAVATALAVLLASPGAALAGDDSQGARVRRVREVDHRAAECDGRRDDHVAADRRAVPRAHRRLRPARPGDQRVHLAEPEGARRGRGARRRAESRPDARAAARDSDRDQGQLRHRRSADHRRLARAAEFCRRARRVHGAEAAPGGRRRHRQDQPPRAGLWHHVYQLVGRADAQSLRSDAQPGRIERRHGRGGRGDLRGGRHGDRHVRIDPHSVRAQQPVRPARHARALQPRRDHPAVADAGHRRAARAIGRPI